MNITDFASKLNGRNYRDEITDEEIQIAKDNNLLIVFGYSDDCVELRGAVYEEFSEGNTILIGKPNETIMVEVNDIEDWEDFIGVYKKFDKIGAIQVENCQKEPTNYITSEYGMNGWEFETDLPCARFEIFDDEETHGIGLVIDLN